MPSSQLDRVKAYAVAAGGDLRLVQGAGGNFSVKTHDVMWIKASGTRLSRALDEQIFVPMRLADTRAAVLETEDLTPYVVQGESTDGLRPSIETSLHALLPHRVVLHVHSTGAIAAGLGDEPGAALDSLPGWFDTAVVPYAKPGVLLARAVLAEIGHEPADAPLALLLLNHGLVAAADDVETAERIVEAVQQAFAARPEPADAGTDAGTDGWEPLHPAGTLTDDEAAVLRLGPFTPDASVFLGAVPFTTRADPDPTSLVATDDDGSVWVRTGTGADEVEIARSLVDVARLVRGARATPLTPDQVDELINWEAEKWRRQLKR